MARSIAPSGLLLNRLATYQGAPDDAILTISVVDPACGSGHFLLAAARRLATHLGTSRLRLHDDMEALATSSSCPECRGDGYRVEARVQVYRAENATRVPASALFRSGTEWAVFTVVSGVARLRTVQLGQRNDEHAQALAGVVAGERVILHPSDKVKDGEAVGLR